MAVLESWSSMLFCIVIGSVFLRWLIKYVKQMLELPPGPWGLPIVGYLPWLTEQIHTDFVRIGEKYGGLFSLTTGNETFVVLNDWPTIKETLIQNSKIFSGRKTNFLFKAINDKDMAFSNNMFWRPQRHLAMQAMKCVGMSKTMMEDQITHLVDCLINKLKRFNNQQINLHKELEKEFSTFNWQLISRLKVSEVEEDMQEFLDDIGIFNNGVRNSNPLVVLPWLRFVPPDGFGYWKYMRSLKRIVKRIEELINKHSTNMTYDESIITYHLHKYQNIPNKQPPYQKDYLTGTVFNLISGSYETTLATTLVGFYHLCKQPKIQEKIQKEMDTVIGRYRLPSLSDVPNLLYLEATILELHRISSIVPLAIPHAVQETVKIKGYVIPKNTNCIQNIYAVHHDPRLWEEPESFKPERFLSKENKIQIPPHYMPFSLGPRICPGQEFAEMELRLVFSSLLHNFNFSFSKNQPEPVLKFKMGVTNFPEPYHLTVTSRD